MKGMVALIVPDQLKGEPFVSAGTAPPGLNPLTMLFVIRASTRAPNAKIAVIACVVVRRSLVSVESLARFASHDIAPLRSFQRCKPRSVGVCCCLVSNLVGVFLNLVSGVRVSGLLNSGGSEVWLPEYDALSLLWVFHHALRTGCVEFLLGDGSVIVGIDLRKVHDVRSGVCLR